MPFINPIPEEKTLDGTLTLLAEGYEYIYNRRKEYGSDIFQTRLLGQTAICMGGKEAAELFYDEDKFERKGALPKRIQKSLFGEKGVQTLDGQAHTHRKKMFMSLMTPDRLHILEDLTREEWRKKIPDWEKKDEIILLEEAQEVLCRAACRWAGVPLREEEAKERAEDMAAMVDSFAAVGLRHRKGRVARRKSEKWAQELIVQIREGKLVAPEDTAANMMALHRDLNGQLLDEKVAAVELLNIIRPIVAIGLYVVFAADALHHYPESRAKLLENADGQGTYAQWFVQEVRRLYPFTPLLGAKVREDFTYKGISFEKGTMVLIDIYGTTHDPSLWDEPDRFRPERFEHWHGSPFDLIPQGGGDFIRNHRCAGEWLTIDIMKVTLDFLNRDITYEVPEQDLHIDLSRIPAEPESRFVMKNIRRK